MFRRVCFIGTGLIGGSLARVMRARNLCETIVGCSRNEANLQKAVELGVIDEYRTSISEAVADADLVVVATPLGAMQTVFTEMKNHVRDDTVITDVGSAKASVVTAARKGFGSVPENFVPGHPIAGTENSGVEASFPELFQDRKVILTPVENTSSDAVAKVRAVWEKAGAHVVEMNVEHHDEILAATSHLPHVLAFSLVDTLANLSEHDEIFDYAAGGFRDFTRIASSDPVMWRDICLDNNLAILSMIEEFQSGLEDLKNAIESRNGDKILEIFCNAKKARDDANIK